MQPESGQSGALGGRVEAPFTRDQVKSLNRYQKSGVMHEFTCPNRGDGRHSLGTCLVAVEEGWRCRHCDYQQTWAHGFMADWSWESLRVDLDPEGQPDV